MFDYFDSKFLIVFFCDLMTMLSIYVVFVNFSHEDSFDIDRIKKLNISFYNNSILTYHLMYLLFMYLDSSIYMNYNYYFYEIIRWVLVYLMWSIENNHYAQEYSESSRNKKRYIEQSIFFALNYGKYVYFMNLFGINRVIDFKCVLNKRIFNDNFSISKNRKKQIKLIKEDMIKCNKQRIILYQIDPLEYNLNYDPNEIIEENIYILYPILVINPCKINDSNYENMNSIKYNFCESKCENECSKSNLNESLINDKISCDNESIKQSNAININDNDSNNSLSKSNLLDNNEYFKKTKIIISDFLQNCTVGFIAHFKNE